MSAATANRNAKRKESDRQAYQMAINTVIYKHTLISVRNADGYAYPARSGTSTDKFVGVSEESKTATANGDKVRVHKTGTFEFIASGMALTNVGDAVYASDDQTVTTTSTNNQLVGYIEEYISATLVKVRIDRAVQ